MPLYSVYENNNLLSTAEVNNDYVVLNFRPQMLVKSPLKVQNLQRIC